MCANTICPKCSGEKIRVGVVLGQVLRGGLDEEVRSE